MRLKVNVGVMTVFPIRIFQCTAPSEIYSIIYFRFFFKGII